MPYLGWYNERHPPPLPKERGGHNQVWGPGGTEPRQLGPQRGAEFKRLAARLAVEPLEADERRISGRAIEPLRGCGCPVEEVRAFDGSTRRSLRRTRNCRGIAIDSSAAGVQCEKPAVAAGRIEHVLVRSPNSPPDQSGGRLRRRVVGPPGLLVGYPMLDRLHLTTARAMAPRASREYTAQPPSAPTICRSPCQAVQRLLTPPCGDPLPPSSASTWTLRRPPPADPPLAESPWTHPRSCPCPGCS